MTRPQTIEERLDRLESLDQIRQLPAKYALTLDMRDIDAMVSLFAPDVRVNAIAPSVTLVSGPQSRANFEKAHVMNALGRGVDVSDLVRALIYLVETPTVTGQTLVIDAGQRFLALPRDVAYMVHP